MNTNNRATNINHIIAQRRPLADRIQQVEENLRSLRGKILNLKNYRDHLLRTSDDSDKLGNLKEINLQTLLSNIESELVEITKLNSRFSRDTLNIGVVGRAGQGKSRLLQSLSGLTSVEIPTGDRSHCTGVRSTIYHHPNIETYGEVTFHSEQSFLEEVIAPYYTKLELGVKPSSIEAFAKTPLPHLPENMAKSAQMGAMYEHLKNYHTNLEQYRHLLGKASPTQISRHQIREYVAQDNENGDRIYYNYLAVQDAKVICSFPNSDVGQIALIDMPGLGDTGLGDDKRLIKTLGEDVDIVLFIRLPRPPRDYWADVDVELYDIAKSALVSLPLEQWSFLILNQTNTDTAIGDNQVYCQDLANALELTHINVSECIIANCGDSQEANEKILDPVLNYLAQEIQTLDQQYAATRQEKLQQLQIQVTTELEKADLALGEVSGKEDWFPTFISFSNSLWDNLTAGLEALLKELEEMRNEQDTDFIEQVKEALQECHDDPGIPSLEEIERRRDRVGGYPIAYNEYLNEVRAHLSQKFLSLDKGLKRSLDQVKSKVAAVLINQGRLRRLSEQEGVAFLNEITVLISDSERSGQLSELKQGFEILNSFELSYRGLVQHRIRQCLDDLTPDTASLQLSSHPSAEEVFDCLESLQAEAVYQCKSALDDLLIEPSQAAFAIVEEFVDRVLRAKSVKDKWFIFWQKFRFEIWPEEFGQLEERTRIHGEWLEKIEAVKDANQLEKLKFLS